MYVEVNETVYGNVPLVVMNRWLTSVPLMLARPIELAPSPQ